MLTSLRPGRRGLKLPKVAPDTQAILKKAGEPETLPKWAARWVNEKEKEKQQKGEKPRRGSLLRNADWMAGMAGRRAMMAVGLLKLGQATTQAAGTGLARLSRETKEGVTGGTEQQFFFPSSTKREVGVWQSKLTPLLNRADSGPGQAKRSDGVMLEVDGQTWHRGTSVLKTAQGERTLTHLQSLSLPSTHYYFNRRLSDQDAVGIITGQKGFSPKTKEGYVGQVSELESLSPAWASLKRGLIQAHVRWGEPAEPTEKKEETSGQDRSEYVHPLDRVKDTVKLGEKEYPVMVRRVSDGQLADATYFDEKAGAWKPVEDEAVRARLAERVRTGRLEPWEGAEVSH
jgi:hypothetical protein